MNALRWAWRALKREPFWFVCASLLLLSAASVLRHAGCA